MKTAAACWTAAAAILLYAILTGDAGMCYELLVPQNYTALSGDLEVKLIGTQPRKITGRLHLLRASTDQTFVAIAAVPITNESSSVKFPCGVVALGGHYQIKFISNDISEEAEIVEAKPEELDVFWPVAHLSLDSKEDKTYPESPVKAILEFPDKKCEVAAGSVNPELWMELIYCGHSLTGCIENTSLSKVLYRRQVIGYPRLHELPLSCELFGLAGHYVLTLKTSLPNTVPVLRGEPPHLKLAVSDKFVFNVHARSILPCDSFSGGVAVLFQYPACEPRVDRVRLFAKLRADVASLAPPTTLHYVVEQRIPTGAHSLRFSCELFSERYVEYCFVYVNEAITGAVTDVRMDCVATLPVRDSDTGGWGKWSSWTQCTSSCGGGTRSRYRFCDSPPPRYGARFCEGPSLETEDCGVGTDTWGCLLAPSVSLPVDNPEVVAEVGIGCRCGCVVHLGIAKPRRLLATSTISCPGRTFWLIQADEGSVIRLRFQHVRLPCGLQWLKVRDGDSLGANLVALLSGRTNPRPITSSSNFLLLEFFSNDVPNTCRGSFLAHAEQIVSPPNNISLALDEISVLTAESPSLSVIHILAAVFVAVVLLVSTLLAAQSLFRYRKYQLAMSRDSELGSAPSRSTLLSEVISLRRLRPGRSSIHTRLRDEEEEDIIDSEPEYEIIEGVSSTSLQEEKNQDEREGSTPAPTPSMTDQKTPILQNHRSVSPVNETEEEEISPEKQRTVSKRRHFSSALSTAPSSLSSVTTVTNGWSSQKGSSKERKEKRNLERLLAGGCSELSLAVGDTDLELDYYDYNVSNAGAVPGSFLGMDPQYLVWIPPFAPGSWEEEGGELMEMSARSQSNEEQVNNLINKSTTRSQHLPTSDGEETQKITNRYTKSVPRMLHHLASDCEETMEFIPLTNRGPDERLTKKAAIVQLRPREKETHVEKSPSNYETDCYEDIKFVDEEEEEEEEEEEDEDVDTDNDVDDNEVCEESKNHIGVIITDNKTTRA